MARFLPCPSRLAPERAPSPGEIAAARRGPIGVRIASQMNAWFMNDLPMLNASRNQNAVLMTPPSTRSAAPLVADDRGLAT
jgi:hypothetical protein